MQRLKKSIMNYLLKLWNGIMRSRNEMTERLIITMKKSGRASRKSYSMKQFFKLETRTI